MQQENAVDRNSIEKLTGSAMDNLINLVTWTIAMTATRRLHDNLLNPHFRRYFTISK